MFEVAEQFNARVILVGDHRQHRSVTAGEPLKLLEDKAGLRVAEVTEILRKQGDYKKAAKALSEGQAGVAFEELDKLGWIKEVDDKERYQQLADAYLDGRRREEIQRRIQVGDSSCRRPTPRRAPSPTAIRTGLRAKGRTRR